MSKFILFLILVILFLMLIGFINIVLPALKRIILFLGPMEDGHKITVYDLIVKIEKIENKLDSIELDNLGLIHKDINLTSKTLIDVCDTLKSTNEKIEESNRYLCEISIRDFHSIEHKINTVTDRLDEIYTWLYRGNLTDGELELRIQHLKNKEFHEFEQKMHEEHQGNLNN